MKRSTKRKIKRFLLQMSYIWNIRTDRENDELEALILSHALEKCMGVRNPEPGRGLEKAERLAKILRNMDQSSFAYNEGVAVLKAFADFQKQKGGDASSLQALTKDLSSGWCEGGCKEMGLDEFKKGMDFDFESFVKTRHSVRYYSSEPVSAEDIERAVNMAKYAPSACNRQPWKFYYCLDKKISRQIRELIPSQNFLEDIPYFGLVTVDRSCFNPDEIGQWDVNGGIFTSHLILALHSLGIGSCCFQIPKSGATNKKAAGLGIGQNDEIIAAIGFGKYPESATCLRAQRRESSEIAIQLR